MTSHNTKQGGYFLMNKKKYNRQKIKMVEGFEGSENAEYKKKEEEMKKKIDEFNGLVEEYEMKYKDLINEKLYVDADINSLLGKTVSYNDKIYYVTSTGIAREIKNNNNLPLNQFYNTDSWRAYECSPPEKNITRTQFNALKKGQPLKQKFDSALGTGLNAYISQKCHDSWVTGGSFQIKNSIDHSVAWIDDLGNRYKFSDTNVKHPTCGTSGPISLTGREFQLMDEYEKGPLTPKDICPSQRQPTQIQLNTINNRMKALAIEMKTIINDMKRDAGNTDSIIQEKANDYDAIVNELYNKRRTIKALEKEIFSLEGNIRDNTYGVKSINLNYLAWGVSFATLVGLSFMVIKK